MEPLGENQLRPASSPARAKSPRRAPSAEEAAAAERAAPARLGRPQSSGAQGRRGLRRRGRRGRADATGGTARADSVEALRSTGKVAALSPRLATASPPRLRHAPRRHDRRRRGPRLWRRPKSNGPRGGIKSAERRAAARKAAEDFANEDLDDDAPKKPSRRGSVEALRGAGKVAALSPRLATASPPRMTSPRPASPRPTSSPRPPPWRPPKSNVRRRAGSLRREA